MVKKFDHFCIFITGICLCIFITKFCIKQTDSFTILAISSNHPYRSEFFTHPLTKEEEKELNKALNQPYRYFGQGGQTYVFFSEDGNYVIKFFKQRLFRPSWILNHLPLPPFLHKFRAKKNWKRKDKMRRDFFSYKVASEELKNETGILYSHLNPTKHLQVKLSIQDRLRIWHTLDLDHFDFIVQYRADLAFDKIEYLLMQDKIQEAKEAIAQVFALIAKRAEKGFRDRDPNIQTNCGFIGNQAIKIDVGRFMPSEEIKNKETRNEDILKITAHFEDWIRTNHPNLLPHYLEIKNTYLK